MPAAPASACRLVAAAFYKPLAGSFRLFGSLDESSFCEGDTCWNEAATRRAGTHNLGAAFVRWVLSCWGGGGASAHCWMGVGGGAVDAFWAVLGTLEGLVRPHVQFTGQTQLKRERHMLE